MMRTDPSQAGAAVFSLLICQCVKVGFWSRPVVDGVETGFVEQYTQWQSHPNHRTCEHVTLHSKWDSEYVIKDPEMRLSW